MNWKRFIPGFFLGALVAGVNMWLILSHPDPWHSQSKMIAWAIMFAMVGSIFAWMCAAVVNFGRGGFIKDGGSRVYITPAPMTGGLALGFFLPNAGTLIVGLYWQFVLTYF